MEYQGLEKISPAEAWGDEGGFNDWLHREGLGLLDKELGLGLQPVSREYSVGTFRSDLLVEMENGKRAVIESQFGRSNHVHFGELLTYFGLSGIDKAVWICEESCREHIDSLTKLNRILKSTIFYMVSFTVKRLGTQLAVKTVDFQVEVPGRRDRGGTKVENKARLFWTQFLKKAPAYSSRLAGINPTQYYALGVKVGLPGMVYGFWINQHESFIGFYLDLGPDRASQTISRFEYLRSNKSSIESILGKELDWRGGSTSTATVRCKVGDLGYQDKDSWDEIQDAMLGEFSRLEKTLDPLVEGLRKSG